MNPRLLVTDFQHGVGNSCTIDAKIVFVVLCKQQSGYGIITVVLLHELTGMCPYSLEAWLLPF